MTSQDYWKMFLETGAPEMYLLYTSARRMEMPNVFDDTGSGFAGNGLQ